ncbi:MAG: GTP cyclohydrolase FolE2 [Myxococcota bacterium]|nr:GTP cyclohydrolase FolE2 [Myxococcota bacterium]
MTSTPTLLRDGDRLPDHASERDDRALPIQRVGIKRLRYPLRVLDQQHEIQSTVGEVELYVSLPAHAKGTHMSRFVEILNATGGEITIRNLPDILAEVQRRLGAHDAYLRVQFPYFISKRAPVSGATSWMEYPCTFHGRKQGPEVDFRLGVRVPIKTLCPCSRAVSDRGAHNQRSLVDVEVRTTSFVWIEQLVQAVEGCASAPLYALLKREDEKFVTEQAYDNPRFVEDLVREVVLAVRELPGVHWVQVQAENIESIHNHSAFADLTWSDSDTKNEDYPVLGTVPSLPDRVRTDESFGTWLRRKRADHHFSQRKLATHLDLSPGYLSRVESDEKQLSPDALQRLAGLLGLDPEKVLLRAGILPPRVRERIANDPEAFLSWMDQVQTAAP